MKENKCLKTSFVQNGIKIRQESSFVFDIALLGIDVFVHIYLSQYDPSCSN